MSAADPQSLETPSVTATPGSLGPLVFLCFLVGYTGSELQNVLLNDSNGQLCGRWSLTEEEERAVGSVWAYHLHGQSTVCQCQTMQGDTGGHAAGSDQSAVD